MTPGWSAMRRSWSSTFRGWWITPKPNEARLLLLQSHGDTEGAGGRVADFHVVDADHRLRRVRVFPGAEIQTEHTPREFLGPLVLAHPGHLAARDAFLVGRIPPVAHVGAVDHGDRLGAPALV